VLKRDGDFALNVERGSFELVGKNQVHMYSVG